MRPIWNWASPRHGPEKKNYSPIVLLSVKWCVFGRVFEVLHVYGSDFHIWVYNLYKTPCIYLLKNLNRTLFFKKIYIYFITDLFSFT